ncbi:putative glycoside hydrolase [Thaumasiovibrio sp. DFM-14]|uniref:putative glycoside hydrolase n=1 Tax=Thaumasiovibrio sp. DFM-14 TaxID=3384792 RepID=UPI0039A016EC
MTLVNNKSLIIGSLSLTLLTGCLDDPYDYPQGEPLPPGETKRVNIYGPESDGNFPLRVIDSEGYEADVPESGYLTQGNISTLALSTERQGQINVQVKENKSGRILNSATNPINIDVKADNALLAFNLRVNRKPELLQKVKLITQQAYGVDTASLDISSAVMAYTGSTEQTVNIPLTCFDGMNFGETLTPFMLASDNNLNIDLGSIRISEYEDSIDNLEDIQILACNNDSIRIGENDGDLFVLPYDNEDGAETGWAKAITTWLTDGSELRVDWPRGGDGFFTIDYRETNDGVNGGILLFPSMNEDKYRDISAFMEKGALQFKIEVGDYGTHPTRRIQVQMETDEFGNSSEYFLPVGFALNQTETVTIPLKELFSDENGVVQVNKIQNIAKPFSLLPEWVGEDQNIGDMTIHIGNVRLTMEP